MHNLKEREESEVELFSLLYFLVLSCVDLSPNDVGYYGCKACVVGERPDMYYSEEAYLTVGREESKPNGGGPSVVSHTQFHPLVYVRLAG